MILVGGPGHCNRSDRDTDFGKGGHLKMDKRDDVKIVQLQESVT